MRFLWQSDLSFIILLLTSLFAFTAGEGEGKRTFYASPLTCHFLWHARVNVPEPKTIKQA